MNRVLIATLLFILICMASFPYNNMLPKKSVNFINNYFNYDDIVIYFDLDRYWQEVSENLSPTPINFIDKKVLNTVKNKS